MTDTLETPEIARIRAALAAEAQPAARGVPEGWRLVPAEPTQEMYQSVIHNGYYHDDPAKVRSVLRSEYQDMLAAAPQPAAQPKCEPDGELSEALAALIAGVKALEDRRAVDAARIRKSEAEVQILWDVAYEGLERGDAFYSVVTALTQQTREQAEKYFTAQPERKPMTDDKAKALIQQRFMTGLNMERDHDVLFRSAGTPSNVWGMDLVWLIRESEAFHGIKDTP